MSNLKIVYDTESTGLHTGFKSKPVDHHSHAQLVQLSALVIDVDTKRVEQSMNYIIKPEDYEIPEAAAAIHGITTEIALARGMPLRDALVPFLHLWGGGSEPLPLERIAHNARFDKNMIATAIARSFGAGELVDEWLSGRDFCTMSAANPVVEARGKTGRRKVPTLEEAYEFLFGESFSNAHTANADVEATMNVYLALKEKGYA